MLSIDEAIAHVRKVAEEQRELFRLCPYPSQECNGADICKCLKNKHDGCIKCAKEHEQLAEWLEELKALRLLLDWAIECDFGLDSFPEEYEKYKHTLTDDMTYKDMIIQIAKCVVAEEIKEQNR